MKGVGKPFPAISCDERTRLIKNDAILLTQDELPSGINQCNAFNPNNISGIIGTFYNEDDQEIIQNLKSYYDDYPTSGNPGDYFCKSDDGLDADRNSCKIVKQVLQDGGNGEDGGDNEGTESTHPAKPGSRTELNSESSLYTIPKTIANVFTSGVSVLLIILLVTGVLSYIATSTGLLIVFIYLLFLYIF